MPDEKGLLSTEELRIVSEKFTELERKRGSDLPCEVCHNTMWMSTPGLVGLKSDIKDANSAHVRLPSVAFVCSNCGNVKLFAASFMGITPFVDGGSTDGS